jgi:hypothetical protein
MNRLIPPYLLPSKGVTIKNDRRQQLEAANQFPKRVRVTSRTYAYLEAEIDAWLEAKVAARDAGEKAA